MGARDLALLFASGVVACSMAGEAKARHPQSVPEEARAAEAVVGPNPAPLAATASATTEPEVAAPSAPPLKARRSPYAYANDDPADDFVVGPPEPREDCHDALEAAGVKYRDAALPVHMPSHSQLVCGAEQVVVYQGSPSKIVFDPTPVVTCTMALALARFEVLVQEEATRALGQRVVRITQLGTYNCREMAAYRGWISEHAFANAIDVESFVLANGKRVSIAHDFERGDETHTRGGDFLRALSHRAYDEEVFSNVLTPFFDKLHWNHFHLDLARYRNDGTRPQQEEP